MKKKSKADSKRFTHEGVAVREVRPGYYMIDHQRNGRRERRCFTSMTEAKTYAAMLAVAIRNEGSAVLDLSPDQRIDAVKAIRLADGAVSLHDAVAFWMRHNGLTKGLTLAEVADKWLFALRAQGCRDTTLAEREQKLTRLIRAMGDRAVANITRDTLVGWLDEMKLTGATRDGYRRCYRAMLQFAVEENMLAANPAAGIKRVRMDERLPTPFTVKQVAAIMAAVERTEPELVPYLAIQFYAGLRPGEAAGMDWRAVDFEEGIIRVAPETSKVRRTRLIDMTDQLKAWLAPHGRPSGPLCPFDKEAVRYRLMQKTSNSQSGGVIGAAGVEWIQDGPRKTFASMHYATHQDAGRLAAILGHTGGFDVLYRHYRGLVTKTEAARYWKLRPAAGEDNIVHMKGAAA
jgi:integrase